MVKNICRNFDAFYMIKRIMDDARNPFEARPRIETSIFHKAANDALELVNFPLRDSHDLYATLVAASLNRAVITKRVSSDFKN